MRMIGKSDGPTAVAVIKRTYEDYIDMPYILEKLYMDPKAYLSGMKGVTIQYA